MFPHDAKVTETCCTHSCSAVYSSCCLVVIIVSQLLSWFLSLLWELWVGTLEALCSRTWKVVCCLSQIHTFLQAPTSAERSACIVLSRFVICVLFAFLVSQTSDKQPSILNGNHWKLWDSFYGFGLLLSLGGHDAHFERLIDDASLNSALTCSR